jgi:hypothetical protein
MLAVRGVPGRPGTAASRFGHASKQMARLWQRSSSEIIRRGRRRTPVHLPAAQESAAPAAIDGGEIDSYGNAHAIT